MVNFTDPIKAGFGRYLHGFFKQLQADTPALVEYVSRDFAKAAAWAPGRMVDQAEEMLAAYRKNDTSGQDRAAPFLPMMIAAMSKDYIPAPADYMRPAADPIDVMIPGDEKQRIFKMRVAGADIRAQVAIFAADDATARSMAMQLALYAQALENRRFTARFPLVGGLSDDWPVVLEAPDLQAISAPTDVKNLTVLVIDIQFRATIPLLSWPRGSEANDGKGDGTAADPNGYAVVQQADIKTGVDPAGALQEWTVP